jgi:hypothetical protein
MTGLSGTCVGTCVGTNSTESRALVILKNVAFVNATGGRPERNLYQIPYQNFGPDGCKETILLVLKCISYLSSIYFGIE